MMRSNKFRFILLHCLAFLLIGSWICPLTRPFWDEADKTVFLFFNQSLNFHPLWAKFWALLNWTKERPLSILVMVGAYFFVIFRYKEKRLEQFFHLFSFVIIVEIFLMLSRFATHDLIHIKRYSPSLIFSETVHLSSYFPHLSIKDTSHSSFPGDHATVFILWASYFWIFPTPRSYRLFSLGVAVLAILPRLFAGAHWFTDIIVGSLSIVLLILAWTLYTPLHERLFIAFGKFSTLFRNYVKRLYKATKKL